MFVIRPAILTLIIMNLPVWAYAAQVTFDVVNAANHRATVHLIKPGKGGINYGPVGGKDEYSACDISEAHIEYSGAEILHTWEDLPANQGLDQLYIDTALTLELELDQPICFAAISEYSGVPEDIYSGIYDLREIAESLDYINNTAKIGTFYYGENDDKLPYSEELPFAYSYRFGFNMEATTYVVDIHFNNRKKLFFYQPYMGDNCYHSKSRRVFGGDAGPYVDGVNEDYTQVPLFLRKNMENPNEEELSFCYSVEDGARQQTYGPYKVTPQELSNKNTSVGKIDVTTTSDTCFTPINSETELCDPY